MATDEQTPPGGYPTPGGRPVSRSGGRSLVLAAGGGVVGVLAGLWLWWTIGFTMRTGSAQVMSSVVVGLVLLTSVTLGVAGSRAPRRCIWLGVGLGILALVAFATVNLGGYLIGSGLALVAGSLGLIAGLMAPVAEPPG